MSRSSSCELSALLEVVRLVEEEGVSIEQLSSSSAKTGSFTQKEHPIAPHHHHSGSGPSWPPKPPPHPTRDAVMQQAQAKDADPSSSDRKSNLIPGGPCFSCGITEAPQWRRPDPGTMLLCNRCGIHYMRYRKLPGPKKEQQQATRFSAPSSPAQGKRKAESWDGQVQGNLSFTVGSFPGATTLEQYLSNATAAVAATAPSTALPQSQQSNDVCVLPKQVCMRRHTSTSSSGPASSGHDDGAHTMDVDGQPAKQEPEVMSAAAAAVSINLASIPMLGTNLSATLDVEQLLKTLIAVNQINSVSAPVHGAASIAAAVTTQVEPPAMQGYEPRAPHQMTAPSSAMQPPVSASLGMSQNASQPHAHAVAYVSLLSAGSGQLSNSNSMLQTLKSGQLEESIQANVL